MKQFKTLVALVLALMLTLSVASVAFAADPAYSITVENTSTTSSINGKTYKAYKVFDLTLGAPNSAGEYTAYSYTIKSTDWAFSTLTAGATTDATTKVITTKYGVKLTPSASDSTNYFVDGTDMDATNARALADALQKAGLPATADGKAVGASEQATISLSAAGYYAVYGVIIPTDPKADPAEEVIAALALTSTDPSATVNPKAEVPPLDKKITGEHTLDTAGKAATAEVGKTVSFELDSNVPDLTGFSDYTFKISDTMTSGLTFTDPEGDATNDVKVTVGGTDKTTDVTISVSGQTLTVTVPFSVLSAANKGDAIVVTYSAVVNSNALTTDYEKNTANLEYSNNPTSNTTNKTPDKEVYVIDVDINVDKVANSADGAKLKDAEFKVFKGSTQPADNDLAWYKWDASNKVVTWVAKADADTFKTGNDGKFTPAVQGLEAEATGTSYGLLETAAPAGYNPLPAPVIVTLTSAYAENTTGKTATVTATGATVTNGTVTLSAAQNSNQPLATAQIINNSGTELPSTGGIGTTIFYIAGAVLVLGAAAIVIARRKAEQH